MLVFSPRIGTSDVLPGSIGSGGAVMSWASLYSGFDCEASVLTGYSIINMIVADVNNIQSYRIFSKIGIWHGELNLLVYSFQDRLVGGQIQ
jgi:hypothetical protein